MISRKNIALPQIKNKKLGNLFGGLRESVSPRESNQGGGGGGGGKEGSDHKTFWRSKCFYSSTIFTNIRFQCFVV